MKRILRALFVATPLLYVGAFAVPNASATAIDAVNANTSILTGSGCAGFTCGYEFMPTTDISVVALGQYDWNADGLWATADVGLWTAGGTLLAQATVPSGTAATLSNGVRYVDITPVTLFAGVHYVIGSAYALAELSYDAAVSDFAPEITPVKGLFANTAVLTFPSTADPFGRLFVGPSFEFDTAPAPVPEPATLLLLGTGIAGSIARARRRS